MKRFYMVTAAVMLFFCTVFDKSAGAYAVIDQVSSTKIISNTQSQEVVVKDTELYAKSAVLIDGDSGRILYGKNELAQMPMASTTKIMTCILALEYGNLEDEVTVTSYAAAMPKVKLGMRAEEKYTLKDLLYSLMLESHNDSAVAIAEHIGGSVKGFAKLMNEKAAELGCFNTYFITPNGLDDEEIVDGEKKVHSTSAVDLARIMKYCIEESSKKEEFLNITRTSSYSFTNTGGKRNFNCNNHNAFLSMMDGALSGKTGFTGNAGYCYVGALEQDGKTFIVALLACGWPNNKSYKWSDTKKLMNFGLKNYVQKDIFEKDKKFDEILVKDGIPKGESESLNRDVFTQLELKNESLELLLNERDQVEVIYELPKQLKAPVYKGQIVGYAKYILNGEVISQYPIKVTDDVEKINFAWCLKKVFDFVTP